MTYHLAVWALIPLLVASVSCFVVAACRLGCGFVVNGCTALGVNAYSIGVQVGSHEGREQGCEEENGGCGTHLECSERAWMPKTSERMCR